MELRHLTTFIHVCEFMSFSKAAEHLGYTQSSVTQQIRQLETELGVELFERTGKRFSISTKGLELLPYANRLASLAAETKEAISNAGEPSGILRIGAIESTCNYILPPVLKQYLEVWPSVQISVRNATTLEIMEMLRKNQVDLILTLDKKIAAPEWKTAWEQPVNIVFLCSPEHPFAGRENVLLKDILEENLLLTEPGCNYRQVFEHDCAERGLEIKSNLEIGSISNILDFTTHNFGITFLPESAAHAELQKGTLSAFRLEDYSMHMLVQLIYRKDKWISPAIKEFIKLSMRIGGCQGKT